LLYLVYMTMERMNSPQGRAGMTQEMDTLDVIQLGQRIMEKAREASDVTKKMNADGVSDIERDQLFAQLETIVAEGVEFGKRKTRLEASLLAIQ
jgi:hypothetical protein